MLSIEEVRALIEGGEKYTDAEIEEIRSSCYELASLAFDCWLAEQQKDKQSS